MNRFFLIFLFFFLSAIAAFAQIKPTAKPTPPVTETTKADAEGDKVGDIKLSLMITEAEANVRLCALAPEGETCKGRNPSVELADLYAQAVKRPQVIKDLVANIQSSYAEMKEGARSAPQVSQAADEASVKAQMLILAQNQRIIELLEQLVRKRP